METTTDDHKEIPGIEGDPSSPVATTDEAERVALESNHRRTSPYEIRHKETSSLLLQEKWRLADCFELVRGQNYGEGGITSVKPDGQSETPKWLHQNL